MHRDQNVSAHQQCPPRCTIVSTFSEKCPVIRNEFDYECFCSPGIGEINPVTGDRIDDDDNPGGGGGGDDCDEPLPCTACVDTGWESYGTGYEIKKTGGTCVNNSCTSTGECINQTIEYRCATGYWGKSTNGTSGCISCPAPGTSTPPANYVIQCYVPKNTALSDNTGDYTFTNDCYYN